MRRFIIAAAVAIGLIAIWAVVLPLTAQPAPRSAPGSAPGATSPALSKALFLCRGPNGIDRACAASLARALVLDASDPAPTRVSDRICPVDPQAFARLDRRD